MCLWHLTLTTKRSRVNKEKIYSNQSLISLDSKLTNKVMIKMKFKIIKLLSSKIISQIHLFRRANHSDPRRRKIRVKIKDILFIKISNLWIIFLSRLKWCKFLMLIPRGQQEINKIWKAKIIWVLEEIFMLIVGEALEI